MPIQINTADLESAVTEAEGVEASVVAFINGFADKISAAVAAALEQDKAANEASAAAAQAAIDGVKTRVLGIATGLGNAINT